MFPLLLTTMAHADSRLITLLADEGQQQAALAAMAFVGGPADKVAGFLKHPRLGDLACKVLVRLPDARGEVTNAFRKGRLCVVPHLHGLLPASEVLPKLTRWLRGNDAHQRDAAFRGLVLYGADAAHLAVELVVEGESVPGALVPLGIDVLGPLAKDHRGAAEALGFVNDPAVVMWLGRCEAHTRASCAASLGKTGLASARSPLIRYTQDSDVRVQQRAVEALAALGVEPQDCDTLNTLGTVSRSKRGFLGCDVQPQEPAEGMQETLVDIEVHELDRLFGTGAGLSTTEDQVRAVARLPWHDTTRRTLIERAAVSPDVVAVRRLMDDPDVRVVVAAALTAAKAGVTEAEPVAVALLQHNQSHVRAAALDCLIELGVRGDLVIDRLENDPGLTGRPVDLALRFPNELLNHVRQHPDAKSARGAFRWMRPPNPDSIALIVNRVRAGESDTVDALTLQTWIDEGF